MKATVLLAAVGSLAFAGSAFANETRVYTGQGGAIPGGTGGITTRFEILVPDTGIIKDVAQLDLLGFNQTWVGDLRIVLTHKASGTSVTIMDRPGVPENNPFGNSDDLIGNYTFVDGGPLIPQNNGAGGATIIPPGIYGIEGPGSLADFVGLDKAGIWSLAITDFDAADNGSFASWQITINNVPAPGALALLGLAGLTARRRRRSA